MPRLCGRPRTPTLDGAGGMKLLFDQNLSYKLADQLSTDFPGSAHIREFGLANASDREIGHWQPLKALLLSRMTLTFSSEPC